MLTWEQIQFEHELIKRMPWTFKNLTIKILQTKYCKMCEKFSLQELASIEFDMLFDFVLFCSQKSKSIKMPWNILVHNPKCLSLHSETMSKEEYSYDCINLWIKYDCDTK